MGDLLFSMFGLIGKKRERERERERIRSIPVALDLSLSTVLEMHILHSTPHDDKQDVRMHICAWLCLLHHHHRVVEAGLWWGQCRPTYV